MLDAEGLSGFLWNLGWPSEGQTVTFSGFFAVGAVTFSGFPKSQREWLPQLEHATVLSISKLICQLTVCVLLEVILEANKCA